MNTLTTMRFNEQLNKEKDQRRAWAAHGKQQEVYDVKSDQFKQLVGLKDTLETVCAEPSRTGLTDVPEPPSRRKQLKMLRDEMRQTLANVDQKIAENEGPVVDPLLEAAKAEARERGKRPPHLRGAQLLKETIGCA